MTGSCRKIFRFDSVPTHDSATIMRYHGPFTPQDFGRGELRDYHCTLHVLVDDDARALGLLDDFL